MLVLVTVKNVDGLFETILSAGPRISIELQEDVMDWLKFLSNMMRSKCVCGKKATQFPHGIPCCNEHACDAECLSWLGEACNCSKSKNNS